MKIDFRQRIFSLKSRDEFNETALEIFRFQAAANPVYNEYISALKISPADIRSVEKIPFLPVSFFKNHRVVSGKGKEEMVFESSGTTGLATSRHFVTDASIYERSFMNCFRLFYGEPERWLFIALLPSYSERENSSLIYMADRLIRSSRFPSSGFYNHGPDSLIGVLEKAKNDGVETLLLGVSFALLDLAEKFHPDLCGITVVETGGMKGRRKEITRQELHSSLKQAFNINDIHSEYGMTELLSQAWSKGNGIFYCPPWMDVLIRDPQDPLTIFNESGRTGGINIIDLANINSCSFISVNDLGKLQGDGGFEVSADSTTLIYGGVIC
jgi:phenylacetate-coenzyme A ligase PaaK-like adenylate-forming protein